MIGCSLVVFLLCSYWEGHKFTIHKDYDAKKGILNVEDTIGKLARWRLFLLEFECDIVHRAGIKSHAADTLSRIETGGMDISDLDEDLQEMLVSLT